MTEIRDFKPVMASTSKSL